MKLNTLNTMLATIGLAAFTVFTGATSFAASRQEIDASVSATLTQFDSLNPHHHALLQKAAGVLIFPHVTKGGAGVAAEYGQGVLQIKGKTKGYYSVSSASIGATLGVAKHSEIIVFMTQNSLDQFVNSNGWSIGADAGIAIVKGVAGDYDTQTLQQSILGFVFGEKGLIADVSLEGTKINKLEKLS
ncbi:MAG TPA: lipid-binding SYLF domain-containing protein [Steroidobacteraceae bacterium]|nr:lipid-binding SYLF domain-containing protein [Steroidobacteraceae bacterium]